jgi:hypothetical protein
MKLCKKAVKMDSRNRGADLTKGNLESCRMKDVKLEATGERKGSTGTRGRCE